MPTDYRVAGLATNSLLWMSADYFDAFSGSVGGPISYLDSPNSFREHLQYNSNPSINPSVFGGADGITAVNMPLSRTIPPGSERNNATYAAQREMAKRKEIRRNSSFMLAGINLDIDAGDWIDYLNIYENGVTANKYSINGIVGNIVFDFMKQVTTVGDVYNMYGRL